MEDDLKVTNFWHYEERQFCVCPNCGETVEITEAYVMRGGRFGGGFEIRCQKCGEPFVATA